MSGRMFSLLLFSVALSGLAQVSFKFGVSATSVRLAMAGGSVPELLTAILLSPGVLLGLALYGVGTLIWLGVLSTTELSQAYPFVGLSFVVTALLGHWLLHEMFSASRIMGTALIVLGVILVARG